MPKTAEHKHTLEFFADQEPLRVRPYKEQVLALKHFFTQRGCTFVGSTIMYSFMQAVGMVNDHLVTCHRHAALLPMAFIVIPLSLTARLVYEGF